MHYHSTQPFDVPARNYARLEAMSIWTQATVSVWEPFFVFPPGRQLRDMVQTEHILARDGGSTGNDQLGLCLRNGALHVAGCICVSRMQ